MTPDNFPLPASEPARSAPPFSSNAPFDTAPFDTAPLDTVRDADANDGRNLDRSELTQLRALVAEQSRLVETLARRVVSLEQALSTSAASTVPPASAAPSAAPLPVADTAASQSRSSAPARRDRFRSKDPVNVETDDQPQGRRDFLRLAGAAAAGATAMALGSASPAAAVDGGSYSGTETVFTNTGSDSTKAGVKGAFQNANGIGVSGEATSGSVAAGVLGTSTSGYGVFGYSVDGYSICAGGNGRLGLYPHIAGSGTPSSGGYLLGDIVRNQAGDTFSCVVEGTGGAAKFRKLAGPGTAGQLHFFPQPTRFVNSSSNIRITTLNGRVDITLAGQTQGINTVPAGAVSIFGTVYGVARAQTSGWVTLFPSDGDPNSGYLSASATFTNAYFQGAFFMVKLSSAGALAIFTSSLSDVIIDIAGYTA